MKILQVMVQNSDGFRDPKQNAARLRILDAALAIAQRKKCAVAHFPAGFLAVAGRSPKDIEARVADVAANELRKRAKKAGVSLVLGVDHATGAEKVAELPYYGLIVAASGTISGPFKQQSEANHRADEEDFVVATEQNAIDPDQRTVTLKGRKVAMMICGEMHNKWSVDSLAGKGIRGVFVCGHGGLGTGLVPSISRVSRVAETTVSHVQHLRGRDRNSHVAVWRRGAVVHRAHPVRRNLRDDGVLWWSYAVDSL